MVNSQVMHLFRSIAFFLKTYVASSPRRMAAVLDAGLLAFRYLLHSHAPVGQGAALSMPVVVSRTLRLVASLTDAVQLQHIRELDPKIAGELLAAAENDAAEAGVEGHPNVDDADDSVSLNGGVSARSSVVVSMLGGSSASAGVRAGVLSMTQAQRAMRQELRKNSTHELIALCLLQELVNLGPNNPIAQRLCATELSKLHFYRGPSDAWWLSTVSQLLSKAETASMIVDLQTKAALQAFSRSLDQLRSSQKVQSNLRETDLDASEIERQEWTDMFASGAFGSVEPWEMLAYSSTVASTPNQHPLQPNNLSHTNSARSSYKSTTSDTPSARLSHNIEKHISNANIHEPSFFITKAADENLSLITAAFSKTDRQGSHSLKNIPTANDVEESPVEVDTSRPKQKRVVRR